MQTDRIAEIIYETAISEDKELSLIANQGIFHMPELAFAYQCGKAILKEAHTIFDGLNVTWIREENLGNGGPTDLVFKLENGDTLAIEFKFRDTTTSYEKDIIKLCKITKPNTLKIFCALIDVFDSKLPDDGRQRYIESLTGYRVIPLLKKSFSTKQNWYKSDTSCVVGVWSVSLNETDYFKLTQTC